MDPVFLRSVFYVLIFLPVFAFAIFIAWYIPGKVILEKLFNKKSAVEKITISLIIGMCLWGFQGLIFGYLHLRFLTYIYLLIFVLIWTWNVELLKPIVKKKKSNLVAIVKDNWLLLLVFIAGIFGQIQTFLISGFEFSDGLRMFTGSSDDLFWHTALINQLVVNFPPQQPGLSGELVKNYHYVSNLLVAELIRIFKLPLIPTQYIFFYTLLSVLIGLAAYTLGKSLGLSKKGVIIIVFLQYFTSDIIYLISYIARKTFEFSVHPLEDGTMFLENPPRAVASIVSLTVVIILIEFLKKKDIRTGILLSIVSGIVVGLKVHHGVLILSSLGILSLYLLFTRQYKLLIYPLITLCLSLTIYLPVNLGAGAPVFVLLDMPRMFVGQEKVGLSRWELSRQIYEQHNNIPQLIRMYSMMFIVFLLAQFGIKNLGFIPFKATLHKLSLPLALFIYGGILTTIFLGTFFIQPVAGADIFNFYLSGSLFMGIITAVTLDRWFSTKSKKILFLLILVLITLTLPRWIYKTSTVKSYFTNSTPIIKREELQAMEFINKTTARDSLVLVFNSGQWDSVYPYVSAFSDRKMFLSGQVILGRHGINFKNRATLVKRLESTKDSKMFRQILIKKKITHLYFYSNPSQSVKISSIPGKKIFYNNSITIYKVK